MLRRYTSEGGAVAGMIILLGLGIPMIFVVAWLVSRADPRFNVMVVLSFAAAIVGGIVMIFQECEVAEPGVSYCATCGYDLRGNTTGVCPECGKARAP